MSASDHPHENSRSQTFRIVVETELFPISSKRLPFSYGLYFEIERLSRLLDFVFDENRLWELKLKNKFCIYSLSLSLTFFIYFNYGTKLQKWCIRTDR